MLLHKASRTPPLCTPHGPLGFMLVGLSLWTKAQSKGLDNNEEGKKSKGEEDSWRIREKKLIYVCFQQKLCIPHVFFPFFLWWWSGFEPQTLHILCIVPTN